MTTYGEDDQDTRERIFRDLAQSFRDLAQNPLTITANMSRDASPRTGSVSFSQDVLSQSVVGKRTSVTKKEINPISQPFGHNASLTEHETHDRDRLVRRLEAVEHLIGGQHHLGQLGSQTEVVSSPGDFRYLPSTTMQASNGGIPERFAHGRESVSVLNNVTVRETKRAKARASDIDYQRRCSSSPSALRASIGLPPPLANALQGGSNYQNQNLTTHWGASPFQRTFPGLSDPVISGLTRQRSPSLNASSIYLDDGEYVIHLSFEDQRVEHRVIPVMLVDQLAEDAADIFGLDSHGMVLVLFGAQPHTLQLQRRLLDPPPV
jgi:hypothetical protein